VSQSVLSASIEIIKRTGLAEQCAVPHDHLSGANISNGSNNVGEWNEKTRGEFNFLTNRAGLIKYWQERASEPPSCGGNDGQLLVATCNLDYFNQN
jgi:hypothetical protein